MAVGNLEFIKSASATSVALLDVTDCFSNKYDVYAVTVEVFDGGYLKGARLRFLDSGGTVIDQSEYDYATLNMLSSTAFSQSKATNTTFINGAGVAEASPNGSGGIHYIYNPYDSSSYTFTTMQYSGRVNTGAISGSGIKGIGVHKSAEQLSGIRIYASSGTFGEMNVSVYGVK